MSNLALMLASMVPFEHIVDKLQDEINEYKANPCQDSKDSLCAVAAMLLTAQITNGDLEQAIKLSDKYDKMKERDNLFNPGEN